ncbi:hypothetical protein BH11PLA2_BH11PLA2_40190 [soil metagenome]
MTTHPNEAWVVQQSRNISMVFAEVAIKSEFLIMDMDTKLTMQFRDTLESDGLEVMRVGPRKPNQNAFAERFDQNIKPNDSIILFAALSGI